MTISCYVYLILAVSSFSSFFFHLKHRDDKFNWHCYCLLIVYSVFVLAEAVFEDATTTGCMDEK